MRPPGRQTTLLAIPVYTGQAQGKRKKHLKRGAKGPGSLPLSGAWSLSSPSLPLSLFLHVFWVGMPSHLEDVFSFIF